LNAKPVMIEELRNSICTFDRAIPVLIRADREVGLQAFVDVLDVVKNLGFRKVSLQTEVKR
jgi:biopolymer transport protein ExbD